MADSSQVRQCCVCKKTERKVRVNEQRGTGLIRCAACNEVVNHAQTSLQSQKYTPTKFWNKWICGDSCKQFLPGQRKMKCCCRLRLCEINGFRSSNDKDAPFFTDIARELIRLEQNEGPFTPEKRRELIEKLKNPDWGTTSAINLPYTFGNESSTLNHGLQQGSEKRPRLEIDATTATSLVSTNSSADLAFQVLTSTCGKQTMVASSTAMSCNTILSEKCGELQKCNRAFTVACKQPVDTYGTCGLTASRSELGRALEIMNNIEMNTTVDWDTVDTMLERMDHLVTASIAHDEATAEQLTTTKVANIAFTHLLLSNEHIPVLEIFEDSQLCPFIAKQSLQINPAYLANVMDFRNIDNGEDFVFYRQGYIHEITRAIQTISSLSPSAGVQELESSFSFKDILLDVTSLFSRLPGDWRNTEHRSNPSLQNEHASSVSLETLKKAYERFENTIDTIASTAMEKETIGNRPLTYNRFAIRLWSRFGPCIRLIKKMRPNLGPQARNLFQQTTDIVPFVFRLSRMVSAIITFDIVTQTAKEILKSKVVWNLTSVEDLLLLPPFGKLNIRSPESFGSDILLALKKLEKVLSVPSWISRRLSSGTLTLGAIKDAMESGIQVYIGQFVPLLNDCVEIVNQLLSLYNEHPDKNLWTGEVSYILYRVILQEDNALDNATKSLSQLEEELSNQIKDSSNSLQAGLFSTKRKIRADLVKIAEAICTTSRAFESMAINASRDKLLVTLLPPLFVPRLFRLCSPKYFKFDAIVHLLLNPQNMLQHYSELVQQILEEAKGIRTLFEN